MYSVSQRPFFNLFIFSIICHLPDIAWDKEFESQETLLRSEPQTVQSQSSSEAIENPGEADEIARTAGLLVHTVRNEQNPKFKNSQFMSLMRQLRDREAIVEGKEIVHKGPETSNSTSANDWANDFSATVDVKGKGRAVDPSSSGVPQSQLNSAPLASSLGQMPFADLYLDAPPVPLGSLRTNELRTVEGHQVDPNDEYFRQENEDYIKYWEKSMKAATDTRTSQVSQNAQFAEWDLLQRDWDTFEATATGLHETKYKFAAKNPYLSTESSRTRHHMMHSAHFNSMAEVGPVRCRVFVEVLDYI